MHEHSDRASSLGANITVVKAKNLPENERIFFDRTFKLVDK
jgi:hypothetical protein